jgi:hypothetical protein
VSGDLEPSRQIDEERTGRLLKSSYYLERGTSNHDCDSRSQNVAAGEPSKQFFERDSWRSDSWWGPVSKLVIIRVHDNGSSPRQLNPRVIEGWDLALELFLRPVVVTLKNCDERSLGSRESGVITLSQRPDTAMRQTDISNPRISELRDKVRGPIGRTVIDNNLLPVGIRLIKNTANATLDVGREVVNGRYHGDERAGHSLTLSALPSRREGTLACRSRNPIGLPIYRARAAFQIRMKRQNVAAGGQVHSLTQMPMTIR